jgi:hypothetical protein
MILQKKLLQNARYNPIYDVIYEVSVQPGYSDIDSDVVGWAELGQQVKDWKFVYDELKVLVPDSTAFNALTSDEQVAVAKYMIPNPIVVSASGVLGSEYDTYLHSTLVNSVNARQSRWEAAKTIVFTRIVEAMPLLDEVVQAGLYEMFVEGLDSFAKDGVTGLLDYIDSTSTYAASGLKNGAWTPISGGDTLSAISTDIMDVLKNGNY